LPHDEESAGILGSSVLAYDGDDLTRLPLHLRKTNLAQLLAMHAGVARPAAKREESEDWSRPRQALGIKV
jgi:ATP-dependent DNA ligase